MAEPLPEGWFGDTASAGGDELRLHDLRVLFWTDLHTDWPANLAYLDEGVEDGQDGDVLCVCGDISDSMGTLEATLRILRSKFIHVFYCVGNHDVWVGKHANEPYPDSLAKYRAILALCGRLGVLTRPTRIVTDGDVAVWIAPLHSWYHSSWDTAPTPPRHRLRRPTAAPLRQQWMDFLNCKWPRDVCPTDADQRAETTALAELFDAMNDPDALRGRRPDDLVISLSHYLPHEELLPPKHALVHADLPTVVGSDPLRRAVQRLAPDVHLFGHTHIPTDMLIGGTRFLQWPLGSPRERRRILGSWRKDPTPLVVLDTTTTRQRRWHHQMRFYWSVARLPPPSSSSPPPCSPSREAVSTGQEEQDEQDAVDAPDQGTRRG